MTSLLAVQNLTIEFPSAARAPFRRAQGVLSPAPAGISPNASARTIAAVRDLSFSGGFLSAEEKRTLALCRQLRNKVLHTDFCAARNKLNELGIETASGDVLKIDLPVVSIAEVSQKLRAARAGAEGTFVADTLSTNSGSVLGWFLEAGNAGDFQKASIAFKGASAIVDRLAEIEVV